jgi:hypothetical protein
MERLVKYCTASRCCRWFCRGNKATNLGIILFCIFFLCGSMSFGFGLYASTLEDHYKADINPNSNCTTFCGTEKSFPGQVFNTCCAYNGNYFNY